ncbi:MAG: alpha/beta hydrolase [bacterium]|nr:alpha/beta hydrolase [bacterium]
MSDLDNNGKACDVPSCTRAYGTTIRIVLIVIIFAILAYILTLGHHHNDEFHRNIIYALHNGIDLKLDLLEPHNQNGDEILGLAPVLVNIHGGGWSEGDKSENHGLLQSFSKIGWVAISINYRLVPDAVFPDQLDDCRAALKWVVENVEQYGGDPDRIVLWGSSAGAHLALLTAATLNLPYNDIPHGDNGIDFNFGNRIQCVIDMAGPTDLTNLGIWRSDIKSQIYDMLGALENPGNSAEPLPNAREASPITYVDPGDPPVFIVHGLNDDVVPIIQSEALYEALIEAGVDVEFIKVEGLDHVCHL